MTSSLTLELSALGAQLSAKAPATEIPRVPQVSRFSRPGWYELTQLSKRRRIELLTSLPRCLKSSNSSRFSKFAATSKSLFEHRTDASQNSSAIGATDDSPALQGGVSCPKESRIPWGRQNSLATKTLSCLRHSTLQIHLPSAEALGYLLPSRSARLDSSAFNSDASHNSGFQLA